MEQNAIRNDWLGPDGYQYGPATTGRARGFLRTIVDAFGGFDFVGPDVFVI